MDNELKDRVKRAKKIAKDSWDNYMKKCGTHNPNLKRKWYSFTNDGGEKVYALEGTPDKAFVVVTKRGHVLALRQDMKVLARLKKGD